jgi:hypothetical protein
MSRVTVHDEVAAYWYDADHDDCALLRQGDVLADVWRQSGREYVVVVSQSCDLRSDPPPDVELAPADTLELTLLENGQLFNSLEQIRRGQQIDRVMLPRRPGRFETELIVHLDETFKLPGKLVCAAVEQSAAVARARETLTWVVAHQVALRASRPAIRVPIPEFSWVRPAALQLDPFVPGGRPYPAREIPLRAQRYTGAEATGREAEQWTRVWVDGYDLLSSAAPTADEARDALAAKLTELRESPAAAGTRLAEIMTRVSEVYF